MMKSALWWLFVLLAGCADLTPSAPVHSGVDFQWWDNAIRPQDDLYRHASGKWLDTMSIPPDRARFGAFDELRERSELRLRSLIEGLQPHLDPDSDINAWKVYTLYHDFMDEPSIENRGGQPLMPLLTRIDSIRTQDALPRMMAELAAMDVPMPVEFFVAPDARATTQYAVYLSQGGLGMPDRDYYLNETDPKIESARKAYLSYLVRLFTLARYGNPALAAQNALSLETAMASAQWSKVENRDALKTYNKLGIRELDHQLGPGFGWTTWLTTLDIEARANEVIVRQPSYIGALSNLITSHSLDAWKDYLKGRVLDAFAPYLSSEFVTAQFQFHGLAVRGVPENRPRWKRAVAVVEGSMGEALGKLYVEAVFPESSKARMQDLVNHLLGAYKISIENLTWMDSTTRQEALNKLALLHTKIGYPDHWRDYSSLEIRAGDLLGNLIRASQFEARRQIHKLGNPIDREEWGMTPQTVNAYYSARMNEIVFPAAILQPPFFDPESDDAVNYGAIGAVIGHEISHAFDDQGSQSDGLGNLRNWWTDADRERFRLRTRALADQYAAYSPLPGYHVNGELTLGENIADNSGLAIAFKAYHLALNGVDAPVLDGLSGDQRFYYGWVQIWRSLIRDQETIRLLKVDPHSPPAFRADGALVNQPGFQNAFGTHPGDRLYRSPDQEIILW